MDLKAVCDRYFDHLETERNLALNTIESYRRDLLRLRQFLAKEGIFRLEAVTHEALQVFAAHLAQVGHAPASQARALSATRQLFVYARRQHLIDSDPAQELTNPHHRRVLPSVPSAAEANRLFSSPVEKTPQGLRNRAALELLYGAGLRASELCQLRVRDIDLRQGVLSFEGKKKRQRVIPIGEPAIEALENYLRHGRPALLRGATHDFVFLGHKGRAISRMGLFKIVRRLAEAAGMEESVSPHKLRHAFAAHLLQGGADLRAVQQMLGHASIATTEIYTHVADVELTRCIDEHHPLKEIGRVPVPENPNISGR